MAKKIALIAGSTGIVGLNLANHLAQQEDWTVYGLARKPRFTDRRLEARRAGSPNVSPAREGWVFHPSR